MGRIKAAAAPFTLTTSRATRLYRLLTLLGSGPQKRTTLLTRLKLDVRGFYRDLEAVRALGIEVTAAADARYALTGSLDDALGRFPFPDPGLNVREALQLSAGGTPAHRKLRQRINSFLTSPSPTRSGGPNKPR
jgi:hypothetical protein